MLPMYIIYFAAGKNSKKQTFVNALGFILGFSSLFVLLGALAGTLGSFITRYNNIFNIIFGIIIILFGINYTGLVKIPILNTTKRINSDIKPSGFFSAVLFGIIFAAGHSPCVGAFLSSALIMAASSQTALKGILLLLVYSLGLGIPFLVCALIIDSLKSTINFIKKHYTVINIVCGSLLIIIGILMATGLLNRVMRALI